MSNKKNTTFRTPKGTAVYPWLNVADTQFDAAGVFKVDLRMTKEQAKPLVDAVKAAADEAFGAKANTATLPFKTDDQTGDIIVKTKSKFRPRFVDSQGNRIPEGNVPQVFGGSELKLGGQIHCYDIANRRGVSMQLGAVQLITLAENSYGGDMAFEAEEGGYVASNDNAGDEAAAAGEADYNF
jgi:hypothetical protein